MKLFKALKEFFVGEPTWDDFGILNHWETEPLPDHTPPKEFPKRAESGSNNEVWNAFYQWYLLKNESMLYMKFDRASISIKYSYRLKQFVTIVDTVNGDHHYTHISHTELHPFLIEWSKILGEMEGYAYRKKLRDEQDKKDLATELDRFGYLPSVKDKTFYLYIGDTYDVMMTVTYNIWSKSYHCRIKEYDRVHSQNYYDIQSVYLLASRLLNKHDGAMTYSSEIN